MFGSEYSNQPEILLSSFEEMSHDYKKKTINQKKLGIRFLQKLYIKLFGIPEVGFQIRSLYFENIIKPLFNKKFKHILDAGSGIGTYSMWLARKYPDARIFGGDVSREKIKFSTEFAKKTNVSNVDFGYLDITKAKVGKKFDLIVNIDVLEHIKDYKKVIHNFYNLLAKNGYLYIHTPQPGQRRIFKSLRAWSHEEHIHEGYTPEELTLELKKAGFRIIVLLETFGFFGKLAWELNHLSFKKGFIISGILYPFLYPIACLDPVFRNKNGLGTVILAKKL